MSDAHPMMTAIDAEIQRRNAKDEVDSLRREYLSIVRNPDPAKADRLLEIASLMKVSVNDVKADIAHFQSLKEPQVASPPPPPALDLSKMASHELIAEGIKRRDAARKPNPGDMPAEAPAEKPVSQMNTRELLEKGIAARGEPKLPQDA